MSKRRRQQSESNTGNGNAHVFDTITVLESQDVSAETKQRRATEKQIRQSMAASSQVKLYDHLMEARILLQRIITTTINKDGVNYEQPTEATNSNGSSSRKSTETSSSTQQNELMQTLLQRLIKARATLTTGRTASTDATLSLVNDNYHALQEEWKSVLNRRYKEVRLHSGLTAKAHFSLLDSDFWQQVDAVTKYELAKQTTTPSTANKDANSATKQTMDFDDSKLYQHLLQDFLLGKSKTSSSVENNNNHNKRRKLHQKSSKSLSSSNKTDRKASKGRKVRYTVFPKLVNFTFPLQRPESILEEDEWFKSLFGGQNRHNKGAGGNGRKE